MRKKKLNKTKKIENKIVLQIAKYKGDKNIQLSYKKREKALKKQDSKSLKLWNSHRKQMKFQRVKKDNKRKKK